ncbi:DUF5134 domain-containing protein [Streptomyces sp. TRM64462]|uniref:DUF5134 domain-containing protein n=1 Tax=Streptomyces sp. TRM64462 TaxID=2741726 RepID=UPI0015865659|nr:DUF5134 domain-containing protein [Streptomyces sp. TRM64462]
MRGPVVSGWLLVVLCGAAGAYCLWRAVRMRRCGADGERREAGGEAVMAFGMAAMGVPAAVVAPPDWSWVVYAAVFGTAALRAAGGLRRGGGRHAHHLVGSLAMVYMAVPLAGGAAAAGAGAGDHAGHLGHAGGGLPLVTGALLAYYAVWVLLAGVRLVPSGTARTGSEMVGACRLVMGTAMLAMLCTV